MAKRQSDILAFPRASVVTFPIVACGCKRSNCGKIVINRDTHIYSRATAEYYSDMECMSRGLGALYEPYEQAVFFDGEWMKVSSFMNELQADWVNDLIPIA